MSPNPDPAVSDHLRPSGRDDADGLPVEPAIYRVVGTGESTVTLLQVGDADERRVHTGRVVVVDRDALDAFESADDPDGNRSAAAAASGALSDFGWQLRAFGRGLRARPLAAAGALALVAVGLFGDAALPVPETWLTLATLAGAVALALVGGRSG